ncbi:MAG: PEGA domain-containing protein [Candidatus Saccharibacteria bacterium]|nr:PEGA domain-containing protein [Candidatus Saccharibacteria bacterium]
MDIEKRARRQSRRVVISEILMFASIIITVLILVFVVSGYWVSPDFTIERQGLLQVYSTPTGADVSIDGSATSWLQRTNTSKTLSAGEHTVTLTKEGYDSWSRRINITEGLLYKLHYPRLFLLDRTKESALISSANFVTVSPDRNTMLLANNTTSWQLFNLDSDSAKPKTLDLAKVLPFADLTNATSAVNSSSTANPSDANSALSVGSFSGNIDSATWSTDNEHVLLKITSDSTTNWLLLSIKNPANSVNLTEEFNTDFSRIEILDSSASNLLALEDGNLHTIDVHAKQLSGILIKDIVSFDYYHQEVIFSAAASEDNLKLITNPPSKEEANSADGSVSSPYFVGILKLGSDEITALKYTPEKERTVIYKFYDEEYIATVGEKTATVYQKNDFVEKTSLGLSFLPEQIKVGSEGDYLAMYTGSNIMTLDMETLSIINWSTDTDSFGWLDGSMLYAVKDGELSVYDFDGQNHRTLASGVSSRFPATITSDKYLYYFSDNTLIREWLVEH